MLNDATKHTYKLRHKRSLDMRRLRSVLEGALQDIEISCDCRRDQCESCKQMLRDRAHIIRNVLRIVDRKQTAK